MALSLSGSVSETPLAEVILELMRSKQSGVLEVTQGKVKKHLGFCEGRPVVIRSNAMSESLGRLLENVGRIPPQASDKLREQAKAESKTLEAYLVDNGLLSRDELARMQNALSQFRLVGLYMLTEGEYRFSAQPVPNGPELPLASAILQATRRRSATAPLLKSLEPRRREKPQAASEPLLAVEDLELSPEALTFYMGLDGTQSLSDLISFSGLPPEEVAILLLTFNQAGMLEAATPALPPRGESIPLAPPPRQPSSPAIPLAPPPPQASRGSEPIVLGTPIAPPPPQASRGTEPIVLGTPIAPPPPQASRGSEPIVLGTPIAPPPPQASRGSEPIVLGTPIAPPPPQASRGTAPISVAPEPARNQDKAATFELDLDSFAPLPEADLEPEAGRYVIGRQAGTAEVAETGGFSIEALIAQEIGELDPSAPVMSRKVEADPILEFSMAGFTSQERDQANRFREDYLRMARQNYFELLGVDRRAKAADIRKAYFGMAKEYHTDRLVNLPEPVQKLGTELFNLIQKAYETLTTSELREKYVAATFYGKVEEEEAAIEEVQIVLQADQHYKTGIGLLNAGNLNGAHAAFTRARELYPKEPEYNACYGFTLFKLNFPGNQARCEEAEKLISDALRQNPKLDRANLFLGRIYAAKENVDMAGKYYVRALKINPSNLEAGRELQQLKTRRDNQDTGLLSGFLSRFKK